jgi:hypothetical protein
MPGVANAQRGWGFTLCLQTLPRMLLATALKGCCWCVPVFARLQVMWGQTSQPQVAAGVGVPGPE